MRLTMTHAEMLNHCESADGALTATNLAALMGVQKQTAGSRLRYLRKHDLIEYEGTGVRGDPYMYHGRP